MKKHLKKLFLIAATSLSLASCSTTHPVTQWEYKIDGPKNLLGVATADVPRIQESYMNALGKDGWIFVSQDNRGLFVFKRPVR